MGTKGTQKATDSETQRRSRKLMGKTSWFKARREGREPPRRETQRHRQITDGRIAPEKQMCERRPNTILFVERTIGGKLASMLRETERDI